MSSSMNNPRRPLRKGFGSGSLGSEAAIADSADSSSLLKVVAASKTSGALNLSNRQLQEVPEAIFALPENDDSVRWWEAVDLTKLDLSHNELCQLPAPLWELSALVTLLLSHNKLQQLPPGMASLASLRLLDLSDNPTLGHTLPEDVALLPSLATLSCNNCGLQALPDALGGPQQPKLSALSVCGNALTSLPQGLACAGALVVLKASNNQLARLPGGLVQGWTALKDLDVAHNKLQELPAELARLPALAQLDARNNALSQLPPKLGAADGAAAALNELRLGFNKLSSLPASLGSLGALRTLDLRNNLIEELPDALCRLQLVLLDLTNNCLRRLPPALGHMTSLRSIPLDGNPLKLMRRELWAGPVSALLQHLRDQEKQQEGAPAQQSSGTGSSSSQPALSGALDVGADGAVSLRGRGLSSIPADVWQADSVTSLDVSENCLTGDAANIAAGLQQLASLRVLSMNSCALTAWPLAGLSTGCLPALHTLELRFNAFGGGCVPDSGLAACPRLKSLDLSGVKSLQLPEGLFAHTPELEVLVACRAGLCEFPAAVLAAGSLRSLNLSGNSITSVPASITCLSKLQELDLMNQLSNLPPQMGLMAPALRVLLLEGNCIRAIRRPVLEKGTAAVLDWLRDRIPGTQF